MVICYSRIAVLNAELESKQCLNMLVKKPDFDYFNLFLILVLIVVLLLFIIT